MREIPYRDGSLMIAADEGEDGEQIIAEATIDGFNPIRHGLYCACGAELQAWSVCGTELSCSRCHCTLAAFALGVRTSR